jgi:glutamate carboxypeptidase
MKAILDFCLRERDWLLETASALVRLESPTADKRAVDRCGDELARRLALLGGRVDRLPRAEAGNHVLAEFGCGSSQVLLLGHFDTVWPVGQLERMPLRTEGGCLFGPGVFDMKAGIAIGLLAVRALYELSVTLSHRVVTLWTSDEESGSVTSRAVVEDEARRSDAVLVLEPALPGGALKTSRKGCGDFELVVSGVAAHAGVDPGRGTSAILELAHQIVALQALQDLDRGVSVNIGVVSGGLRPNVIADEARALIDVRARTMADAAVLEAAVRGLSPRLPGATLRLRGGFKRPPMERSAGVARLFDMAKSVAADLGRRLDEGATGGGSDGNFTVAAGVPTLDGLGAVGDGAHAVHEHVDVDELPWRAALVAGLVSRLAEAPQSTC